MAATLNLSKEASALLSPLSARGSLRLGYLFGIPVFLHWTWFLVAYYELSSRRSVYTSSVWNVAEFLTLFGIVLLHELGHALACRSVGGRVEKIVLWPLGGVAYVQPPPRPGPTLWCVAAGPLVNFLLVPLTFGLYFLAGVNGWAQQPTEAEHFLCRLIVINATLLLFNLLPLYPLDGGQMVHAFLWFFLGRARSLTIVSFVGLLASTALLGVLIAGGQWGLMVLSLFMVVHALRGLARGAQLGQAGWENIVPGQEYLMQGDYDRAITECDQAIAALADDKGNLSMAYLRRAVAQQARGQHEQALADATEAARLAPFELTLFTRGEIYLLQGRYEEAIADFTAALKKGPKLALAFHQRGLAYFLTGNAARAQADLAQAHALDGSLPEIYCPLEDAQQRQEQMTWMVTVCGATLRFAAVPGTEALGRAAAHLTAGRAAEALGEVDEALRLNPQLGQARFIRGEALRQLGRLDEALSELQAAQESAPDSECVQMAQFAVLLEAEQYDQVIALCDTALQANPAQILIREIQAEAYEKQGNPAQAIAVYTDIVQLDADNVEARYRRGILYRKQGKLDLAMADYDECLRREPDNAKVYFFRAIVRKGQGNFHGAVDDYRAAVRLNPDEANYHNNLSCLLSTCPDDGVRDGAEAVRHATRACELTDWQNAGFLDTLASAYAEIANFSEAVRWQEQALADKGFAARSGASARERLQLYAAGRPARA